MEENKNVKLITCPTCGCRELAFVSEYHKSIAIRFLLTLFKGALLVFLFFLLPSIIAGKIQISEISPDALYFFIAVAFIYLLLKFVQISIEAQTHVQAICKDCGKIWNLN